jgi:DNA repair protein RecN (Recombination protein N)
MLRTLSIRNILLIEQLDLSFDSGLCVLTGETGSGKSILLDALSLALGARGNTELISLGADQSTVVAEFEVSETEVINTILFEYGISIDQNFTLRRVVAADGRSRAFIDDQPVSVTLLRQVGCLLVEVHGQLEAHGLLDQTTHRHFVDAYGDYQDLLDSVSSTFKAWRIAIDTYDKAKLNVEMTTREEAFIKHAVNELTLLDPKKDEEQKLANKRNFLMNAEKSIEILQEVSAELEQANGIERTLRTVIQKVQKIANNGGGQFDNAIAALERALIETNDGVSELERLSNVINLDPEELEEIEERLFKLRSLARKHNVDVEYLPDLLIEMSEKLSSLDDSTNFLEALLNDVGQAKEEYITISSKLTKERKKTIAKLNSIITQELKPLKLEAASFHTRLVTLEESAWNEYGIENIIFEVKTNPNTEPGPINKVASGGELARITLALKVVLARAYAIPTVIFDEVDAGIGGAAAAAVGSRLNNLARESQVLVVTHSPQVAALGNTHFQISKISDDKGNKTQVKIISESIRVEEIARMLSGANVSDEARAAAVSLLKPGRSADLVR